MRRYVLSVVGVVHVAHPTVGVLVPWQGRLELVLLCAQNLWFDLVLADFLVLALLLFDLFQVVIESA